MFIQLSSMAATPLALNFCDIDRCFNRNKLYNRKLNHLARVKA